MDSIEKPQAQIPFENLCSCVRISNLTIYETNGVLLLYIGTLNINSIKHNGLRFLCMRKNKTK